jgi:hypothetical protein
MAAIWYKVMFLTLKVLGIVLKCGSFCPIILYWLVLMGCKVEGQGNTELSVQTDDDVHFGILGGLISTFQISLNFFPLLILVC